MNFVKFTDRVGQPVFVNPALVTKVLHLLDDLSEVHFGGDTVVALGMAAGQVVSELEAGARRRA